jgi:hypothetical protein
MPLLGEPSEHTLVEQSPQRPAINLTSFEPVDVDMPMEAFYREYQVDTPGRRVKYLFSCTPFSSSCHITVLSQTSDSTWRARIPELAPQESTFEDTDHQY